MFLKSKYFQKTEKVQRRIQKWNDISTKMPSNLTL